MASSTGKKDTFPFPVLSSIAEGSTRPTYATLLTAQAQLNSNAKSVHSDAGTGRHGHLVLTMAPAEFLALTLNIAHIAPVFPGRAPIYPAGTTVNARAEITGNHKADLFAFHAYYDTENTLRSQLIAACPDTYIRALKDPKQGYGEVTTLALLTHLWDTYGSISMQELNANSKRMLAQWNPPTPIEDLFTQLEEAAAFAILGGAPYGDKNVLHAAYTNIEATGVFTADCRDWETKLEADKTLAHFKDFFSKADKRLATTTSAAGYHTANAVTALSKPLTAADVADIVNKAITQSLAKITAKAHQDTTTVSTNRAPAELSYCYSHGLSTNKRHNSLTCENRVHGHQEKATADNKMGGSDRIYTEADRKPRPARY